LRKSGDLTEGQIATLELTYSSYMFTNPLANGVKSFGMWNPNVETGGSGIITDTRYKRQEGAEDNASMYTHLGILGVTGFLMQDLEINPLEYVEGGKWESRRQEISEWLDSTDPDLTEFYNRGGKIIITVGAGDNLASSGAQLDYYQSLIDEMGQDRLDAFARLYVVANGGHGLNGRSFTENGEGEKIEVRNIPAPNHNQNINMLINWVEINDAPEKTLFIGPKGEISEKPEGEGYMMCSYPNYAKYTGGPIKMVTSYTSEKP
jgi:feruloyl esterase